MSNPDLNVDMNIDLSSASSEFESLSGVVKDLGDQLERTLGILGQYYSRGDLLQKMLDAFNYPNECELPCSADEAIRITNRYTELQNEEKEWGMCHLWK